MGRSVHFCSKIFFLFISIIVFSVSFFLFHFFFFLKVFCLLVPKKEQILKNEKHGLCVAAKESWRGLANMCVVWYFFSCYFFLATAVFFVLGCIVKRHWRDVDRSGHASVAENKKISWILYVSNDNKANNNCICSRASIHIHTYTLTHRPVRAPWWRSSGKLAVHWYWYWH